MGITFCINTIPIPYRRPPSIILYLSALKLYWIVLDKETKQTEGDEEESDEEALRIRGDLHLNTPTIECHYWIIHRDNLSPSPSSLAPSYHQLTLSAKADNKT